MVAPLTLLELIIVETNHSVCLGRRNRSADSETETTCVRNAHCLRLEAHQYQMSAGDGDERAKFADFVLLTEQRFPGDSKGVAAAIPKD
jgi:hypothetical protein